MSSTNKSYTQEFKQEAVNLALKIGGIKAADQLGVSSKLPKDELTPAQMKKKIKQLEK